MYRVHRPTSAAPQTTPSKKSQHVQFQGSEVRNRMQRIFDSVRAFFQSFSSTTPAKHTYSQSRKSFQSQFRNLMVKCPPSVKMMPIWNAFIQEIWQNPESSDEDMVTALEAMVFVRAFQELRGDKMAPGHRTKLFYKMAEEVVQLLRDNARVDVSTSELLKEVTLKMRERNEPQEDQFTRPDFLRAIEKLRIELLNAPETRDNISDANSGKWRKNELRTFHLINYTPNQMSQLGKVIAKLPEDERFADLVRRLID